MSDKTIGGLTVLTYQYRDAANYKVAGEIHLAGIITEQQISRLRETLDNDEQFIPTQLGLQHLGIKGREHYGWTSFPCEDDHVWHELFLTGEGAIEVYTMGQTDGCEPVEEFVKRMEKANADGWDDTVDVRDLT